MHDQASIQELKSMLSEMKELLHQQVSRLKTRSTVTSLSNRHLSKSWQQRDLDDFRRSFKAEDLLDDKRSNKKPEAMKCSVNRSAFQTCWTH